MHLATVQLKKPENLVSGCNVGTVGGTTETFLSVYQIFLGYWGVSSVAL